MPSNKTAVIRYLFEQMRGEYGAGPYTAQQSTVTQDQVVAAIEAVGEGLSARNPANFYKDLIRRASSANSAWPREVFAAGYTATAQAGEQAVFRFVPVEPGSRTPFPPGPLPTPEMLTSPIQVQSLSLSLPSRELRAQDETRIVHVVAQLNVLEAHFMSRRGSGIISAEFLQSGVKLRLGEVDAVWTVHVRGDQDDLEQWLLACEVKGTTDDVLDDQVFKAAHNLLASAADRMGACRAVLPVAVKALDDRQRSLLYVREYAPIRNAGDPLALAAESVIELVPPVPGVGGSARRQRQPGQRAA